MRGRSIPARGGAPLPHSRRRDPDLRPVGRHEMAVPAGRVPEYRPRPGASVPGPRRRTARRRRGVRRSWPRPAPWRGRPSRVASPRPAGRRRSLHGLRPPASQPPRTPPTAPGDGSRVAAGPPVRQRQWRAAQACPRRATEPRRWRHETEATGCRHGRHRCRDARHAASRCFSSVRALAAASSWPCNCSVASATARSAIFVRVACSARTSRAAPAAAAAALTALAVWSRSRLTGRCQSGASNALQIGHSSPGCNGPATTAADRERCAAS